MCMVYDEMKDDWEKYGSLEIFSSQEEKKITASMFFFLFGGEQRKEENE